MRRLAIESLPNFLRNIFSNFRPLKNQFIRNGLITWLNPYPLMTYCVIFTRCFSWRFRRNLGGLEYSENIKRHKKKDISKLSYLFYVVKISKIFIIIIMYNFTSLNLMIADPSVAMKNHGRDLF